MNHGGRVFNKEASLVYSTLNSAEKARLFSITDSKQTVQMTPREVKRAGGKFFAKIRELVHLCMIAYGCIYL